ncbi:MAG: hercynine metabolism small protein [Cyanobium sp.]
MSREEQRQTMRQVREGLIGDLEAVYRQAFEQLSDLELGEGAIARLTQLLLRSREAALTALQEEIEAPLITTPPGSRPPDGVTSFPSEPAEEQA